VVQNEVDNGREKVMKKILVAMWLGKEVMKKVLSTMWLGMEMHKYVSVTSCV
jgi:hypothetical protein